METIHNAHVHDIIIQVHVHVCMYVKSAKSTSFLFTLLV